MNQIQENSFLILTLVWLSLILLYSHRGIDASSAFTVHPNPIAFIAVQTSIKNQVELTTLASLPPNFSPIPSISEQRHEVELWLDLRKTKVAPHVALMHIMKELCDDSSITNEDNKDIVSRSNEYDILADKVLVSLDPSTIHNNSSTVDNDARRQQERCELSKVLMEKMTDEIGLRRGKPVEIVYTLEDQHGCSDKLCCYRLMKEKDKSEVTIGEVVNIQSTNTRGLSSSNMYANTIQAIDIVRGGDWIFLDDDSSNVMMLESISQDKWSKEVQDLVELVSSAACSSLPVLNLDVNDGIDASGGERIHTEVDYNVSLGGIAIGCRTNADILEIGSYAQSLTLKNNEYTTTESGIYINAPSTDESDNINPNRSAVVCTPSAKSSEISKGDSSIRFAAVIPFDISLWKTATLLLK